MQRREFIKKSSLAGLSMLTINEFKEAVGGQQDVKMPVLFVGHGNPMNAIEDNEFTKQWRSIGTKISRPKAILCISAHWLTKDTRVTAMQQPKTIHDFYGFPQELFAVEYKAPGSPEYAKAVIDTVNKTKIMADNDWGLDHGAWSVLKPMFPDADIPVFQLSIDYTKPAAWHYDLAKELKELRSKGVLIMGSGNIVHNLARINWNGTAFDWAIEFDQVAKSLIDKGDFTSLVNYEKLGNAAALSIPTNDHYIPLIYSLALKDKNEEVKYFNDKITMGSISMRSLLIS